MSNHLLQLVESRPKVRPQIALTNAPDIGRLSMLTESDRAEAIDFLKVRPVQTVVMTSFIYDNGIESDLNRGKFYGYRGANGKLEGVALIGHSTLVEARTDEAMVALAIAARRSETPIHLIMSSGDDAHKFWAHLKGSNVEPRIVCTEILFEAAFPFQVGKSRYQITTAKMEMLEPIAQAQADLAFLECGVDPMSKDREGFLKRVARRIEQGRVFTVVDAGKLLFKADIIAETEDTIYLEGIYVHPDHRGEGLGSNCLNALTVELLGRVENICMLSNIDLAGAHKSYAKAGYRRSGQCITLFA